MVIEMAIARTLNLGRVSNGEWMVVCRKEMLLPLEVSLKGQFVSLVESC